MRLRTLLAPNAWGALAASVVTIALVSGGRFSLAPFVRPIEVDLGLDRSVLSNTGALLVLSYGLAQPAAGRLAARFGARGLMMGSVLLTALAGLAMQAVTEPWQLYLWGGVVPGISFAGAGSVPANALLARWFDRRLGLATGLMSAAIPAGLGLFVPLAAVLITFGGWRWAYVVMGLIVAVFALPLLWLYAREPRRVASASHVPARGITPPPGRDLWLLGAGYFGCGYTDQFVALHLVALASDAGVEPLKAAGMLSGLLVVGIIGSAISGPLADAARSSVMLASLYFLRAAALPLLLAVSGGPGEVALGAFVVLFGLTFISNQAPGARLVRDRYGVNAVGPLMGRVGLAHQVGGAVGVVAGGLSVSLGAGYGPAIVVAALVVLAGGLLQLAIPSGGSRRERVVESGL